MSVMPLNWCQHCGARADAVGVGERAGVEAERARVLAIIDELAKYHENDRWESSLLRRIRERVRKEGSEG